MEKIEIEKKLDYEFKNDWDWECFKERYKILNGDLEKSFKWFLESKEYQFESDIEVKTMSKYEKEELLREYELGCD